MESLSVITPEKAYEEAGKSFVRDTEAISRYYYNQAGQDGHVRVIAPKTSVGSERIYAVQSVLYKGYLPNEQGGRSEVGNGIAFVKYNDVSGVGNLFPH